MIIVYFKELLLITFLTKRLITQIMGHLLNNLFNFKRNKKRNGQLIFFSAKKDQESKQRWRFLLIKAWFSHAICDKERSHFFLSSSFPEARSRHTRVHCFHADVLCAQAADNTAPGGDLVGRSRRQWRMDQIFMRSPLTRRSFTDDGDRWPLSKLGIVSNFVIQWALFSSSNNDLFTVNVHLSCGGIFSNFLMHF